MTHARRRARADAAGSPQMAAVGTPQVQELPVLSHAKRRAFIAAYGECGSVTRAASAAGVSRRVHYQWLADADYRRAFMEAREVAADLLEAEVRRRAVDGWDEPVYY